METVIGGDKALVAVSGRERASGAQVSGYEMHMGETTGDDTARPWLALKGGREEGAMSANGRVMGTYVHGLFAEDQFRHAFLSRLHQGHASTLAYEFQVEATLDKLAEHLERHLDTEALFGAAI